jgi:hypothetical protein
MQIKIIMVLRPFINCLRDIAWLLFYLEELGYGE